MGQCRLLQRKQRKGQTGCRGQSVRIVGAEDRPPAVEQLLADGPGAQAVSLGVQIAGGVQDESPAGGGAVTAWGGREYVRGELGVGGPAGWILRVAGRGGREKRHHP